MVGSEEVGNPLAELLRTRVPGAYGAQEDSIVGVRAIRIRVLTRGMERRASHPAESPYHTLPQVGSREGAYREQGALQAGQKPIRRRKPAVRSDDPAEEDSSPHAQSERGADSNSSESDSDSEDSGDEAPTANNVPATQGRIPDALTLEMLNLQSIDTFCQEQSWREYPAGKIEKGRWKGTWYTDSAGLVRNAGVVYVPDDPTIRAEILRVNHDDPWQGGHFGRKRTRKIIRRFYYWPQIARDVRRYVASCDVCQRMKAPRHKPYGLLMPIPQPEGPWTDISLDFVTGLPPSARRKIAYDALLVVVDRYSKMVRLIPCSTSIAAEELGELLVEEIFSKFGLPKSIISDRGTILTSQYWGTLCYYLAIKRRFSTAFHPQTDGQTERMNQTVECYLRCYVNHFQNDWVSLLPSAEYACNNAENATTQKTPFEMVYKYSPSMRKNLAGDPPSSESQAAIQRSESIAEANDRAKEIWQDAQSTWEKYYNRKRTAKHYQVGDLVMLSAKNLRLRKASRKLAERFIGPFEVLKVISANAYTLKLPKKYGRLHNTFHVSLLEPYSKRPGSGVPAPIDLQGEEEWEVDKILDSRQTKQGRKYLVRWKGFSEADDSWEPAEHLLNASAALADYQTQRRGDP